MTNTMVKPTNGAIAAATATTGLSSATQRRNESPQALAAPSMKTCRELLKSILQEKLLRILEQHENPGGRQDAQQPHEALSSLIGERIGDSGLALALICERLGDLSLEAAASTDRLDERALKHATALSYYEKALLHDASGALALWEKASAAKELCLKAQAAWQEHSEEYNWETYGRYMAAPW